MSKVRVELGRWMSLASGAEGESGIIRKRKQKLLIVAWIRNAPDEWDAGAGEG
jgi:hypothetical protein